jgi:hypothetical protein
VEMTGGVKNVNSKSELDDAVKRGISVLHFWASWCEPSRAMEPVLAQLAVDAPQAHFFRVRFLLPFIFACVNLPSSFFFLFFFLFFSVTLVVMDWPCPLAVSCQCLT